jgi:hypothetical protein
VKAITAILLVRRMLASQADGIALAKVQGMSRIAIVFLLAMSLVQQGCFAAAWVAAVGADSMGAGDVRFQPFEASWVSQESASAIVDSPALNSLALMPVDGDEAMGARLNKLLSQETALRLVVASRRDPPLPVMADDHERAVLARQVSRELAVDAVLYGHVVAKTSHPSDWGWKVEEARRLFLYMIDRDGRLLWKDELPFLIVTGKRPAHEDSVQQSLTRHFMDHVRELGLDAAGYLPSKPS